MDNIPPRTSALEGHILPGHFGHKGETGIIFREMPGLILHQIAVWPETLGKVEKVIRKNGHTILQIEPLKFWIVGTAAPALEPQDGASLDLSHSRTHLQVSGPQAHILLNRFLPLNLGRKTFPVGSVASTAFHHVGITLWRSEAGFELFLPRGFALSLWELLCEGATQFGYEVRTD
jgi:methylglutamate dehydrogenase subunit D